MEFLNDFLAWAWARHHNILSWYIRPLFIIPFIYFAYKRSWKGMIVTIIALATSMFWFPAPETVDPMVAGFLAAEQEYLTGAWTAPKILLSLTVPLFFILLALSFWKRSWWWGVAVINLAALGKVVWSVFEGGQSGWAVLVPAVIGLLVCNAAVYFGVKYVNRKSTGLRLFNRYPWSSGPACFSRGASPAPDHGGPGRSQCIRKYFILTRLVGLDTADKHRLLDQRDVFETL